MRQGTRKVSASAAIAALVVMAVLLTSCGEAPEVAEAPPPATEASASPPAPSEPPPATPEPEREPEQPAPPETEGDIYVVQPGDTLAEIANRLYGDHGLWERLYEANRELIGDDPDAIQVGVELRIPPSE